MRSIFFLLALHLASLFAAAESLRVMTFNVRYPNPGDGANVWSARRDLLVETIRSRRPDVIGTQELFYEQCQYIVEKLPEYSWFGLSRRGSHEDEHMGVFYRRDRLRVVESGDFWLSVTPEKPGSVSWNMSLPRMVTWAVFEIAGTGKRFRYFNTHLAHRDVDETARLKSAMLLACRVGLLDNDEPVVGTGDFNAPAGGADPLDAPPATTAEPARRLARRSHAHRPGGHIPRLHRQTAPRAHRLDSLPRSVESRLCGNDHGPQGERVSLRPFPRAGGV